MSDETLLKRMTEWRHQIHRNPELGFEEVETAALISQTLAKLGYEVTQGIGKTGVVASLKKGKSSRMIGIRADMDALAIAEQNSFPHTSQRAGKMHACGHDGHTAMLLGAAHKLAHEAEFDGTIVLIFQPAEEHGCGALAMIEDGLFEKFPVDAIYALHNMPSLETGHVAVTAGPIMAAEDNFEIIINGKGGHAALPHLCQDPVPVAGEIMMALQSLVARKLSPTDSAVVSITDIKTDGTRNVIPNRITLTGDTRSFTPEIQDKIETHMRATCENIAAAHGMAAELHYSHEFAPTINSADEARQVADCALNFLGAEKVQTNCQPIMASEDFGFMLQQKPGCYFLLGNGGTGPGGCGLHSPHYDFNDDILMTGAELWTRLTEQLMPVQA